MTRNEKLHKLANAVREYRGRFIGHSGKWVYPPRPKVLERVCSWLSQLGIEQQSALEKIEGFKSFADFEKWMRGL